MNGSKDNSAHGGGRGAGGGGRGTGSGGGRGLRGGKRKQVAAGKRIDGDIVIDLSLNRDAGNIANGKRRFEMLDPKNPNKKVVVDPNHVWSHGRYLMIRNPDGKSSAFERAGAAGSSSQVGEGDEITMIQNTGGKTIAYKRVGAGSSSHAGEGDERADVSGMADATMPHVSRDNIDDDVFGEDSGDGQESDHGDGGDNDGVGDEGVGDEGVGDEGVGDDGVGDDGVGDEREFIQCDKNGFTNNKVSRSVKDILEQCYDGDWVTFKKVPQSARMRMFDRFRTKYRWRARAEQAIYDTFIDVLKSRFRVIMRNLREKSKQKAKDARREVPVKGYDIATLLAFPPDGFPLEKWQRMCEHWNTEKWQKKSEAGRSNRKNDLCLHTGGSIRFDQHRVNMDKENGKSVGYLKVFLQTHATKECKKMLKDGEITEKDYDQLKFVTEHAKRSYVAYAQQLEDLYGDIECDDLDLWKSLHPESKGRKTFGIGSSDPDFLVTGKISSRICGSNDDARHSQELQKVQAELEKEREARQKIESRFEQFQEEREKERAAQAAWQKAMEEKLKNIGNK